MNSTPLSILVGSQVDTNRKALELMQKALCEHNGCDRCSICALIRDKKSPFTCWLKPTKQHYSLDDLEIITSICQYKTEQSYFFVIEQAELLTELCSNSLLKITEEPPAGYFFLFLTEHTEQLLPTIRSRALVVYGERSTTGLYEHPLVSHFTEQTSPIDFLKLLDKSCPSERESIVIIEDLIQRLMTNHNQYQALAFLEHELARPPMPGGAKIFWRNVYLKFHQELKPLFLRAKA